MKDFVEQFEYPMYYSATYHMILWNGHTQHSKWDEELGRTVSQLTAEASKRGAADALHVTEGDQGSGLGNGAFGADQAMAAYKVKWQGMQSRKSSANLQAEQA